MKTMMHTTILACAAAALATGCMSTGGLVIGPVSKLSANSNARSVAVKSTKVSGMTEEQTRRVVVASASMHDHGAIAVYAGVDVLALSTAKLSWGELARQGGAVVADLVLYGAAAYAIAEGTSGGGGESGGGTSENNISVVGSEGVIIQVQGDTSVVSHRSNHVQ